MFNTIVFNNHDFAYESERLIRSFFQPQIFELYYNSIPPADNFVLTERKIGTNIELTVLLRDGEYITESIILDKNADLKYQEHALGKLIFLVLSRYTGQKPVWGILTGVRPVKFLDKYDNQYIKDFLLVSDEKIALARKISQIQRPIINTICNNSYSLYISIPFCPARCSYCSFVSHSITQAQKLIPQYVELLCKEIEQTAQLAERLGLKLDTIYIGGGTPTVLSVQQLEQVFAALYNFDCTNVREFTVEAGRPDTITLEKLQAIKAAGADRISINPQTMNNNVLKAIGRNHTAEDIEDCFNAAQQVGFKAINSDLIAGLPSDNYDSFCQSIERILQLNPENITVHTLSLKRSSSLYHDPSRPQPHDVGRMVDFAREKIMSESYNPYYLYRQKNAAENYENVGYCLPDSESLYNIFIMEEVQSILACGCSGSTKIVNRAGEINRTFNYKFPYEYINRFDELMRKRESDITKMMENY